MATKKEAAILISSMGDAVELHNCANDWASLDVADVATNVIEPITWEKHATACHGRGQRKYYKPSEPNLNFHCHLTAVYEDLEHTHIVPSFNWSRKLKDRLWQPKHACRL